jgi:hypothetical protein
VNGILVCDCWRLFLSLAVVRVEFFLREEWELRLGWICSAS